MSEKLLDGNTGERVAAGNRRIPGWVFWVSVLLILALQLVQLVLSPLPATALIIMEVSFLLICLSYILSGRLRYGRSIKEFNESEWQLQETRLKLAAFNEHMHALHEFTHKLVEADSAPELAALVTETLVERFLFDSSQFWVRDAATGALRCISRCGYPSMVARVIFTENDGPGGPLVEFLEFALQSNKPIVVGKASDESAHMSPVLLRFIQVLGASSCVVITLFDEDRPIGVLSAERRGDVDVDTRDINVVRSVSQAAMSAIAKGELLRMEDADCQLVESISTVVKTALVKMELFRNMEQQIEQRTTELRATQKAVLEAKEMVVQSEKLSSLGRMAAGVIHEINDPLNFMVNILPDVRRDIEALARARQIIIASVDDPLVRTEIERIGNDADLDSHLQDLEFVFSRSLEAVQKSARIAKGLQVFARDANPEVTGNVDLLVSAQETVRLIPNKIKGQTEITVNMVPGIVWNVNKSQFEQVIMNLLTNAIDAMDQKGAVTITGRKTAQGVDVIVADNGPGIPEKVRTRIFDPFFTTKPAGKSTGLGLSISSEIARKFGGYLTVDSAPGKGASFTISFRPKPASAVAGTGGFKARACL